MAAIKDAARQEDRAPVLKYEREKGAFSCFMKEVQNCGVPMHSNSYCEWKPSGEGFIATPESNGGIQSSSSSSYPPPPPAADQSVDQRGGSRALSEAEIYD